MLGRKIIIVMAAATLSVIPALARSPLLDEQRGILTLAPMREKVTPGGGQHLSLNRSGGPGQPAPARSTGSAGERDGVTAESVTEGGAAARLGLRAGDVVLTVNRKTGTHNRRVARGDARCRKCHRFTRVEGRRAGIHRCSAMSRRLIPCHSPSAKTSA
jgi:hypothetical protein